MIFILIKLDDYDRYSEKKSILIPADSDDEFFNY